MSFKRTFPLLTAAFLVSHSSAQPAAAPVKNDAPAPAAPSTVTPSGSPKAPEPVKVQVTVATEGATKVESTSPPKTDSEQEVAKLNREKEKSVAALQLAQSRLDETLLESRLNTMRLQAELAELKAQEELREYKKKLENDKALAALRDKSNLVALESAVAKAELEISNARLKHVENQYREKTAELVLKMELDQKQSELRTFALQAPVYTKSPLQGSKLTVSDRRIPLNGPITMKTADEITQKINYFNNRDREHPIFIVIDDSPGGSVMAGYKILKAMKGSTAPVYVVVRSYAASMAACITTLADKSFAFPNAVILHHQISSMAGGNLTQQKEWVSEMEEWWKRLADPVAQKMGISREEFIKRMYARNSSGDWSEFGDVAQQLKWVDHLIEEVEETSLLRLEEAKPTESVRVLLPPHQTQTEAVLEEQVDLKGHPYMILPRLNPMDVYWIHNPDGYYRAR